MIMAHFGMLFLRMLYGNEPDATMWFKDNNVILWQSKEKSLVCEEIDKKRFFWNLQFSVQKLTIVVAK